MPRHADRCPTTHRAEPLTIPQRLPGSGKQRVHRQSLLQPANTAVNCCHLQRHRQQLFADHGAATISRQEPGAAVSIGLGGLFAFATLAGVGALALPIAAIRIAGSVPVV